MKTLFLALMVLSTVTFAQDVQSPKQPEWLKYTIPSEAHSNLQNLVGTFTYKMKMWSSPLAKPEESEGTSMNKWILGNRFVQQDFKGKFMGQEFTGIGITGYDNFRSEYQTIWMDSMSTAMFYSAGTNTAVAKVIKQQGKGSNPMTGEREHWFRSELNIQDKNQHTFTMYSKSASGKEYLTMEIVYKRKK